MNIGDFNLKDLGKDLLKNKEFANFVSNFTNELQNNLKNNIDK